MADSPVTQVQLAECIIFDTPIESFESICNRIRKIVADLVRERRFSGALWLSPLDWEMYRNYETSLRNPSLTMGHDGYNCWFEIFVCGRVMRVHVNPGLTDGRYAFQRLDT